MKKIRKRVTIYRHFYLHFTTFSQSFCNVAVWVNVPLTVLGFEFFTAGFSRQCRHHWPSGAWPVTKPKIKTQTTWEASPKIRVKTFSKINQIRRLSTTKIIKEIRRLNFIWAHKMPIIDNTKYKNVQLNSSDMRGQEFCQKFWI